MSRLVRLAAVIAPVLGLAGLWGLSDHTYRQGTEWEVPIEGYDPRDFLRGHYVDFVYDWPGIDEFHGAPPAMLCIEGAAPVVARVTVPDDPADEAACAHPLRASDMGIYGWEALVRGQLYIEQERAAVFQEELLDAEQVGLVTIRQRDDGSFTPVKIRFRPLTAAEKAAREAQNRPLVAPPPITEH